MRADSGIFASFDGVDLFYRCWLPEAEPEKTVAIVHGIGLEGSPYESLGIPLAETGTGVYVFDLRGHGRSGGERGDFGKSRNVVSDIQAFVELIRFRHPESLTYLLAESMGGAFGLGYLADHPDSLDGLILLAPALRLRARQLWSWTTPKFLACCLLNRHKPIVSLVDWRLETSSRDDWFKSFRRTSPEPLSAVSVRYILTIARFILGWSIRYPRRMRVPTLVIQGVSDALMHPPAARRLFEKAKTTDKDLLLLGNAWHTLIWDPETPAVVRAVTDWLSRH